MKAILSPENKSEKTYKFQNPIIVNIPSKSITGEIGRKLLKAGFFHPELDNDLERVCHDLIKTVFQSVFEESHRLFDKIDTSKNIVIEVQDDLGQNSPKTIGSFNIYRTNRDDNFHFSVSGFYLYNLIVKTYDVPVDYLEINDGVVFHEIVHMADYATLKHFNAHLNDAKSTHQAPSDYNIYTTYDPDMRMPREWQFMGVMSHFRNEGIAVLYEILLGYEKSPTISKEEVVNAFRCHFEPLKSIYERPFGSYLQEDESHVYGKLIESLHALSYQVGPWMILDMLRNTGFISDQELLKDAENILQNGGQLSPQDAASIITCAMQNDLGSFLKHLSSTASEGGFLYADEIIGLASYLCVDDNQVYSKAKNVMQKIIESTMNGSKDDFIDALSEIAGSAMDNDEIEEYAQDFFAQPINDENHQYVINKSKSVYERLKQHDSDFDRWVLTFVLDPQDLVDDGVKYLGYLDDALILSAADLLTPQQINS